MQRRTTNKRQTQAVLDKLNDVLKSGLKNGIFSAESRGDVVVRAAYLRGISDAIDIIKSEMEKDTIDGKELQ